MPRRRRSARILNIVFAVIPIVLLGAISSYRLTTSSWTALAVGKAIGSQFYDGLLLVSSSSSSSSSFYHSFNATECGWVDGDAVPVKPFGILVYSSRGRRRLEDNAHSNLTGGQGGRRRLEAIAGGSLRSKKVIPIKQKERRTSPIDRRGKSERVDIFEYPDEPIHFSAENGFRRYLNPIAGNYNVSSTAAATKVPQSCLQQEGSRRRRVVLHVPGNCHWGNYWHFLTECVHAVAVVMNANNITDNDDVHLIMDVASGAGQLPRDRSYETDWGGMYINPCPRGIGKNPWNCSLDTKPEKRVQWWQIMYDPARLRQRALGLDVMELMLHPSAPLHHGEARLHLYNSRTRISDPPGLDLLADLLISGTGRLDVPGQTHNDQPGAFAYARRRILASLGLSDSDQAVTRDKSKMKKALYVSRKNAAQRKVTNEADLLVCLRSVLSRSGFFLIVIHAEKMSVEKQIAVWSSVDLAIVERGAGMANCLFLRPNAAVVYVSNANAYESHSVMLPRPSPRHYKVVPVNGLPECKNFDATCTCNVTAVEGAVIQATRHIWDH